MKLVQPSMMDLLRLCYDARQDEIEQYESLIGPWDYEEAAIAFHHRVGLKFGLMNNEGEVVCAGGWDPVIPGVYQSWMVGTDENWKRYWRSITKHSRIVMDALMKDGARRLQTGALASRTRACDWYVRGLKMQYEGTCKNFGFKGEDMVTFVRLQETLDG